MKYKLSLVILVVASATLHADELPKIFNTQNVGKGLTSPAEALNGMTLPEGFEISLFAAEPDVQQPIALAMDERGRLWVAENYTYAEQPIRFETKLYDRIVILEDKDGDGQFDQRTVFWDKAKKLTSIEIGFGGVWATCAPHLLFIPDRNHDDVPDGEPVVMLEGFNSDTIGHNIVNGLRWGPDGWLYGRHGITTTSYIGTPGMSRAERMKMNCGIWRFHPTRKTFEVVCQGTTNSWGMDWDDHGQMFFINTVIGHLWHVIPGAYYERMFGEHFNPHLYKYIPQTADHVHWDTAERWHDLKRGSMSKTTDQAGGGHAHTGMMIYVGDNWPEKYRGDVFTANLHGCRINCDRLHRHGATYIGKHEDDFMHAKDIWFRGIELCYGPDGGVYIADWSDIGECHDNDGIHRTSGRIYKVNYVGRIANPSAAAANEQKKMDGLAIRPTTDDAKLVALQLHKNDWHVRHARRLLQQRAVAGNDMGNVHAALLKMYDEQKDITRKLRAMWCLHVTGGIDAAWLIKQLSHNNEHTRVWAIKLLVDDGAPTVAVRQALEEVSETESSGLVQTFLASTLNQFPKSERFTIAANITSDDGFADDRVLPLMLWYAIEPAVVEHPNEAIQLAATTKIPLLRRYIARRLTYEIERQPDAVSGLTALLAKRGSAGQTDLLEGMSTALRGWRKAPMPEGWEQVTSVLRKSADDRVRQLERELSLVFGDGRAVEALMKIATSGGDLDVRREAIRTLVASRIDDLVPTLRKLLDNLDMGRDAVRGLAAFNEPDTPKLLIEKINQMRSSGKEEVINVLVSRPAYAAELLDAVAGGKIDRNFVSVFQLRQLQTLGDHRINARIAKLWPELKQISADKVAKINEYREALSTASLAKADLSAGRALFEKSCANCHKLFGKGGAIAPDLTGAQRSNLQYLLENIVDPSATVSKNYHMTIMLLADGRVINGIILSQNERTITVQLPKQKLVFAREEIDEMRISQLSMMPDSQLDFLSDVEVRDLIGYLMSPSQVQLSD